MNAQPTRERARPARWRRGVGIAFWKVFNPINRPAAGRVPWWVLVETTGRRTGKARRTPLAAGPVDSTGMWLLAVHGLDSSWVRNLGANPAIRMRYRGRWHSATARTHPIDPEVVQQFNRYARTGPRVFGIDPVLVRVECDRTQA